MAAALQSPPVSAPSLSVHAAPCKPTELPRIRANEGPYVNSDGVGWLKQSTPDMPVEELRQRFKDDGYLWVKGLIPRETVLEMREAYFRNFQSTGMLKPGTSLRDGVANPANANDAAFKKTEEEILVQAHVSSEYLIFLNHPALRSFIRDFMGWKTELMVKRTLLRHNVPYGPSAPIHYDKIFLRDGEADFLTAWIPIGDCAVTGGGLLYLEGSSVLGLAIEKDFAGRAKALSPEERIHAYNVHMMRSGALGSDAELFAQDMERQRTGEGNRPRWLAASFEAGDVVFHDPYMIHGAAKNEDKDGRIRLSSDLRFYEEGAAADERWMKASWSPDDGL